MANILVVDDDTDLLEELSVFLKAQMYTVETARTVSSAESSLACAVHDLVILDWNLPDGTGLDLLRTLRSRGLPVPVLLLTSKAELSDKVEGYNSGTDDYLTKPFQPAELMCRVQALLRRSTALFNAKVDSSPSNAIASIAAKNNVPQSSQVCGPATLGSIPVSGAAHADQSDIATILQSGAPILPDPYEVIEILGAGYSGVVYKCRHRLLGRMVAVKMVHSHLVGDATQMGRFWLEAKTASSLSHPNLTVLHDFGMSSTGSPFLVMEYVHGKTLDSIIRDEVRLDVCRVLRLSEQLCDAIAYVHNKGMFHRDIKPGNIIITSDELGGEVLKLVDFGLVKVLPQSEHENLRLTQEGETFGTPLYMSPEQCAGLELDCRSDIYSAGCLIYEMLTGIPPFTGKSALQTMFLKLASPPRQFSEIHPKLTFPDGLEAMILKCIAIDRELRHSSAGELRILIKNQLKELQQ